MMNFGALSSLTVGGHMRAASWLITAFVLVSVLNRSDGAVFRQMLRLEARVSAAELERLEAALEPLRRDDMLYHVSGFGCEKAGYATGLHVCEREVRLAELQRELDAATRDKRQPILAAMEQVKARGKELSRARREVEDLQITMLNARDRVARLKAGNPTLFGPTAAT